MKTIKLLGTAMAVLLLMWFAVVVGLFIRGHMMGPDWSIVFKDDGNGVLQLTVNPPIENAENISIVTSILTPKGFVPTTVSIGKKTENLPLGITVNSDLTIRPGSIRMRLQSDSVVFQKNGIWLNGVQISWKEAKSRSPININEHDSGNHSRGQGKRRDKPAWNKE